MPESDARLGYLSDAELAALEPSNTHTLTWRLVVEVRDWRKAHGDCMSKVNAELRAAHAGWNGWMQLAADLEIALRRVLKRASFVCDKDRAEAKAVLDRVPR